MTWTLALFALIYCIIEFSCIFFFLVAQSDSEFETNYFLYSHMSSLYSNLHSKGLGYCSLGFQSNTLCNSNLNTNSSKCHGSLNSECS